VDGSEASKAAVEWCVAHLAPGTEVVAVCVLDQVNFGALPSLYCVPWAAVAEALRDQWCAPLRRAGLICDCRLLDGSRATALRDIAVRKHADALVIGKRSHRAVLDMVLGVIPRRLIHRPPCPVIVVPEIRGSADDPDRADRGDCRSCLAPSRAPASADSTVWSPSRILLMAREQDVMVLDCLVPASDVDARAVPPPSVPTTLRVYLPEALGSSPDIEATLRTWIDDGSTVEVVVCRHEGASMVQFRQEDSGLSLEFEQAPAVS
jgi:nucleotide-binding universal stress UspA family protein